MLSLLSMLKEVLTERMSFAALYNSSEAGRKSRGDSDVNVRPMRVATMDGNEAWTFRYKSDPSTTGHAWHGYIQFFKEDVSSKDNAADLDCMVDCDCPDYRYRYAYNNAHADVGRIGRSPDWPYGNQNNGRKWRPRSQGGVGDYGIGLCKHLCALSEYLKTKIEPEAPEPQDVAPKPKPKPVKPPVRPSVAPQTTKAPDPDTDSYNDSRTGSDTLTEGMSYLYKKIDEFSKQNPEFTVMYEDSTH